MNLIIERVIVIVSLLTMILIAIYWIILELRTIKIKKQKEKKIK